MPRDAEDILAQYYEFRKMLPNSWSAFFARFGTLRPVQEQAIPHVLAGENILVMAPTAGGKTEAVAAPVCERIIRNRWQSLSAIIVTPTRALVNDLYVRLSAACAEMGVQLGRKTADHAFLKNNLPQLLITTPESLESLLTFQRELLAGLRVLIIDEIHLLDCDPRGDQLRLIIGRLKQYLKHRQPADPTGIQRIALSATVSDPERVAARYLGPDAGIVTVGGQRDIEAHIILCEGDDQERAQAAVYAAGELADVTKVLVFVNSRKQVDYGAEFLRCGMFADVPVYAHHGSLSREERERAEEGFKQDRRAICIATMTLEVGIDIGDVDLVICIDPPFSLSSFLQRIGRGCRRMQDRTRVICVARNRSGEILFQSMVNQSRLGMPKGPTTPLRRSVILQQLLAYLRQVDKHRRTMRQFQRAFVSDQAPVVSSELVDQMVRDSISLGLLAEQKGIYEPASYGWDFIESSRIYNNIASPNREVALVDVDTGKAIAYVRDADPSGVRVGGKSFDILPGGGRTKRHVRRREEAGAVPAYHSQSLPYAFDVGYSVARFLDIPKSQVVCVQLNEQLVAMTWLGKLLNSALASPLKEWGRLKAASAFALTLERSQPEEILPLLRKAASTISERNPLGNVPVEKIVSVGPYFWELDELQRRQAREDWLDSEYLLNWAKGLMSIRVVDAESDEGHDYVGLAGL